MSLASGLVAATPRATEGQAGTPNIRPVANFAYESLHGGAGNGGTDSEFATIDGRTYAFMGSYYTGLFIFDVTNAPDITQVGHYDCGIAQGDVQLFQRDGRQYVVFTRDDGYSIVSESACAVWAQEHAAEAFAASGGYGSWIADVTDPTDPKTVSFVPFSKGSHNITVHPSGKWLYNSNSDLITSVVGSVGIEVADITDFAAPTDAGFLALPLRPGLGSESHDVIFNAQGTRAYSAALSQTVIIDTTDPTNPTVISSIFDPAINVEHQATPVTLVDPLLGRREFVIVEDEFAGAIGTGQCPNGGVHVYDITGALELAPVKVGSWYFSLAQAGPTNEVLGGCTAHVFQVHEQEQLMTIAAYNGGVHVVDLSGLVGVALGSEGIGMRELAWFTFDDMDSWSVKAPSVDRDGVFHIYSNDQARGMDVFEVDLSGAAPPAASGQLPGGEWLTPDQALGRAMSNPVDLTTYTPRCLLGDPNADQA